MSFKRIAGVVAALVLALSVTGPALAEVDPK